MNQISLDQFQLITPTPSRDTALALSVMLDGTTRLNGKLNEKFKGRVDALNLYLNADGKQLLLQEVNADAPHARPCPDSGILRTRELSELLPDRGTKLPAHYIVEWNESVHMWCGTLDSFYRFPKASLTSKKLKKIRKTDLTDMMPQ